MISWVFIPPNLNIYTINPEKIFPCPPPFNSGTLPSDWLIANTIEQAYYISFYT